MKLFQRFYYNQIGKKCLILVRGEIRVCRIPQVLTLTCGT